MEIAKPVKWMEDHRFFFADYGELGAWIVFSRNMSLSCETKGWSNTGYVGYLEYIPVVLKSME